MDLYRQIQDAINDLDQSIEALARNGENLAMAERDYKMILTTKALELKTEGMAVTLINQIIYGLPEVASKRFARDVAEANYKANQEFINITKLKLRLLESQLEREWGKNE